MHAIISTRLARQGDSAAQRAITAAVFGAALALLAPRWAEAQQSTSDQGTHAPPEQATPAPAEPKTSAPKAADTHAPAKETHAAKTGEAKHGRKKSGFGGSLSAAGGVSAFSQSEARDFIDTGGTWDLRGVFGTRSWVGVEAAYIGSANRLDTGFESTNLYGSGFELDGRINFLRNRMSASRGFQPYVLGGVAFKNYALNRELATADVDDNDKVVEVPVAAGGAYYLDNGLMFDARGSYRFAFDDNLIDPVGNDGSAGLDNWNVTGRIGYEF